LWLAGRIASEDKAIRASQRVMRWEERAVADRAFHYENSKVNLRMGEEDSSAEPVRSVWRKSQPAPRFTMIHDDVLGCDKPVRQEEGERRTDRLGECLISHQADGGLVDGEFDAHRSLRWKTTLRPQKRGVSRMFGQSCTLRQVAFVHEIMGSLSGL